MSMKLIRERYCTDVVFYYADVDLSFRKLATDSASCMAVPTFRRGDMRGSTIRRISLDRYYELCGERELTP